MTQDQLDHALMEAAWAGSVTESSRLIDSGANVNLRTPEDLTPLLEAVIEGHNKLCEMLLLRGANVHVCTNEGTTALMLSARFNNFGACALLLKNGIDIHARDSDGATALHWACLEADNSLLHLLAKWGADLEANSDNGERPLQKAVTQDHFPAITFLVAMGCKTDGVKGSSDRINRVICMPRLFASAIGGHTEVALEILEDSAEISDWFRPQDAIEVAMKEGHTATGHAIRAWMAKQETRHATTDIIRELAAESAWRTG